MNIFFPLLETCNPTSCSGGKIMFCDRLISNVYRKHLSPYELTNSQFVILMVISKMGNLHQSQISKTLALEKSSVSRNVKRLLTSGLIATQESKELKSTIKGKQLMEKLIPAWENAKKEVDTILGEDGQQALEILKQKLSKI